MTKKTLETFDIKNPVDRHENLTVKILNDLVDVLNASININRKDHNYNEIHNAISTAVLGFAANTICGLSDKISEKEDVHGFIENCHKIFTKYIDVIKDKNNDN